ncbi:Diacylglycerol kinase eta [Triplophysa tibetana]|uniref:Diacylglycerol kinase eta n=1 Tax=Triplophysa tibetana TaxID=1572043 RepID=A0A5A9P1W2_9TELE|nr:Diacylglycerol kinase eta [Triplophysa tibetana]
MTAKKAAFKPLSSSRIPADRKGAAERDYNSQCRDCFSPQEPEKPAETATGIHHPAVGAVGGSGPVVDESSDSEGEQEGPQKLIRKVSTSGQIRSKARLVITHLKLMFVCEFDVCM